MKKFISFNGGGVIGLLEVSILHHLQQDLDEDIYDICEGFAGTSVGSMIALGLEKYSTEELLEVFSNENIRTIFDKSWFDNFTGIVQNQPQFDGLGKTAILDEYLGDRQFVDVQKITIVPVYDLSKYKAEFIKSTNKEKWVGWSFADVCNASSAAPLYFPPFKKNGSFYIDGGVTCNLPSMALYSELIKNGYVREDIKILSITTGDKVVNLKKEYEESVMGWGAINWLMKGYLLDVLMDESPIIHYMDVLLGDNHLHVDPTNHMSEKMQLMDNISIENLNDLYEAGEFVYKENREEMLNFFK